MTLDLLKDKRLLVTGVLTQSSIAFTVARIAQEQGARVLLTGQGRGLSLTQRMARRLPVPPEVVECDVTDAEHLAAVEGHVRSRLGGLDGVLHAIAFAPPSAFGPFVNAPWSDVSTALQVSAYSLTALVRACAPVLEPGASVVALDFDSALAWPGYNWMGVAKAALESSARYLARELGPERVRVNLVAAGPLSTTAARGIPAFAELAASWAPRAPLGWRVDDPEPAARACVALLSDWFPATTGSIVHVDGGVHAVA